MSEDEREVDNEDDGELLNDTNSIGLTDNKRALHNAMERKRRDSIKDSFRGLQDCIPTLRGDKTSRAQVLKKTGDYISQMQVKIAKHQTEINDLKETNAQLEAQIRALEKAKSSYSSPMIRSENLLGQEIDINAQDVIYEDSSSDNSESTHALPQINLVSGGIVKTISGVTLAPSSVSLSSSGANLSSSVALGANAVTLTPATVNIAPGQSLLHSNIRVQPGQSLLLSEPMRKKKRIN